MLQLSPVKKVTRRLFNVIAHAPLGELWNPTIITVSFLMQIVYLLLSHGPIAAKLYRRRHVTTGKQTASFLIGSWVMLVAFTGPLDYLSDNYIFAAHMIQHMIEILIMTPLLMKGVPTGFYMSILRVPVLGRIVRIWLRPIVAGAVFNIVLTGFH